MAPSRPPVLQNKVLQWGIPALTYGYHAQVSRSLGSRRAAGFVQQAGGYVSLHCNIGGEFGERPSCHGKSTTARTKQYIFYRIGRSLVAIADWYSLSNYSHANPCRAPRYTNITCTNRLPSIWYIGLLPLLYWCPKYAEMSSLQLT